MRIFGKKYRLNVNRLLNTVLGCACMSGSLYIGYKLFTSNLHFTYKDLGIMGLWLMFTLGIAFVAEPFNIIKKRKNNK